MSDLPRRDFLMQAAKYDPTKSKVAGHYLSEKLDGTRCFWDGGISRGCATLDVPWSGVTHPKKGGIKAKVKPFATGLWSRYGNPIMAPDWFLNKLPCMPLDGELWAGRGNFQLCRSICAGDAPDSRFDQLQYCVFSAPPLDAVFRDGEIKNQNMHETILLAEVGKWLQKRPEGVRDALHYLPAAATFDNELAMLRESISSDGESVFLLQQIRLSMNEEEAKVQVEERLSKILDSGGEGIVLRDPTASWIPKRGKHALKYKPFDDAEGAVVCFVAGEVGKEGRLLGKMGAMFIRWNDVEFKIGGGFKLHEREFTTGAKFAKDHPGETMPSDTVGQYFKVGDTVTFKYRELSDDGIPKEARFWRKRPPE